MTREECIIQLRDLIKDREPFIDQDDPDDVIRRDVEALRFAVGFLEAH